MAEKNCVYMRKLFFRITLFSVSLSLFFFFFFPFSLFFFVVYRWPYWSCALDQYINIYFKLKSGVLFCKRDFKSSWSAYWPYLRPEKKNISCQDMSLLWNSWFFFFFSVLVDIMTNNIQYTTDCTNLHPTLTSDPPAKVKLAFCTSS